MPVAKISRIDQISEKETKAYLDRRNMLMLEAVIGCFMDTNTPKETAEILRKYADQLEEYS